MTAWQRAHGRAAVWFLLPALGLLAVFALLAGACDFAATLIGQRAGARFILHMHQLIAERTARLPLGWFDAERTGAISNVITRGVTFAANAPESMIRPKSGLSAGACPFISRTASARCFSSSGPTPSTAST